MTFTLRGTAGDSCRQGISGIRVSFRRNFFNMLIVPAFLQTEKRNNVFISAYTTL